MTTPVYMGGTPASPTMAFVMPAEVAARKVPRPTDDQVTVNTIPPGRFAVLRYSGRRTPAKESSAAARLREWMEQERLPSQGTPVLAYFDPPWTPAFLRRNEVMIRIRADAP